MAESMGSSTCSAAIESVILFVSALYDAISVGSSN
jgi:hypothetical protein